MILDEYKKQRDKKLTKKEIDYENGGNNYLYGQQEKRPDGP
jgi:hypothetical protein